MTREAKIGMLTGLGVIVLIGVLLSEYLGETRSLTGGAGSLVMGGAAPAGPSATGRMADLPVGSGFRQQVLEPIGVPGMARGDAPLTGLDGGEVATGMASMPNVPIAFAAEKGAVEAPAPTGPTIGLPVSPIPVGPSPLEQQQVARAGGGGGGPPTISVIEPLRPAPMAPVAPLAPAAPMTTFENTPVLAAKAAAPVQGTTYVIAAGDNLAKIAKKFYQSARMSDVKRIVAANPGTLKSVDAPLLVGKTITIPEAAPGAAASAPTAAVASPQAPSSPSPLAAAPVTVVAPPKAPPSGPFAPAPVKQAASLKPVAPPVMHRPIGAQSADPSRLAEMLSRTTEPVMVYLPGTLDGGNALVPAVPVRAPAPQPQAQRQSPSAGLVQVKKSNVPAMPAPAAKKERVYDVQPGDSLEKIAKKYAPSNPAAMLAKLKAANGLKDSAALKAGQKLRIP